VDLRSVAAELYGLSPAEFVAARDARAAEARQAGDKELVAAIRTLKRPSPAAWLANILARERPEGIEGLVTLGARLRDAQQRLAAHELRNLTRQGHQAVTALVREAGHVAAARDQAASTTVLRQLEQTLDAALADPAAGVALLAGQLVAPLSYAGLGAPIADHTDDAGSSPADDPATEAAERAALASVEKRLSELQSQLDSATHEYDRIRERLDALAREAEQLRDVESAAKTRVGELREAVADASAQAEEARKKTRRPAS
jgi:hypothetical protein